MPPLISESILGYSISHPCSACIDTIIDWLEIPRQRPRYFVCANPHSLVVSASDKIFQQAIRDADLVTPDGIGIVLASKFLGGSIHRRITGSDVFNELNQVLNKKGGYRYFFLGATENTLNALQKRFSVDYPNIVFAGAHSPPYKPAFNDEDNRWMINAINAVSPDVLWVGMTAPKQEKWILQNREKLNVKFIGAIGAVFDFYVGTVKRSPVFFQKVGLEWLPRLIQEPRRLFRRNFVSSPLFIIMIVKQRFGKNGQR